MYLILKSNLKMMMELNSLAVCGYKIEDREVQNSKFYRQAQYAKYIDASSTSKLLSPSAAILMVEIMATAPKLTHLILAKNSYVKDVPEVMEIISTSKTIRVLDLQGNNIGIAALSVIRCLNDMKLEELNLSDNNLGEYAPAILNALKQGFWLDLDKTKCKVHMFSRTREGGAVVENLTVLNLSFNKLGEYTVPMAMAIGGKSLNILNIYSNNLGEYIMKPEMSPVGMDAQNAEPIRIEVDPNLRSRLHTKLVDSNVGNMSVNSAKVEGSYPALDYQVAREPVTPFSLRELAKMKLHTLDLGGNEIGKQLTEVVKIISTLKGFENITDLSIGYNNSEMCILEVVKMLASNMKLTALGLSRSLRAENANEVADVLSKMNLVKLNLGLNHLSDIIIPTTDQCEFMVEFTKILSVSTTLRELYFGYNFFGKFALAVCENLAKMKLDSLGFDHNLLKDDGAMVIDKLSQITTLKGLILDDNDLKLNDIDLTKFANKMPDLIFLSLAGNEFDDKIPKLIKDTTLTRKCALFLPEKGATAENILDMAKYLINSSFNALFCNAANFSLKTKKQVSDIVEDHNDYMFEIYKIIYESEVLDYLKDCVRNIVGEYICDPCHLNFTD